MGGGRVSRLSWPFATSPQKALTFVMRPSTLVPHAGRCGLGRQGTGGQAKHKTKGNPMLNPISIGLIVAVTAASAVAFSILFKKAGLVWWHALIPFYNDYEWMKVTWTKMAFVRRMICLACLCASTYAMHQMGGLTLDSEALSFSFVTPFTLSQSVAGLGMCLSVVWFAIMQLEANWYAADAFDGTLGTFLGMSFLGGFAYLWTAILAWQGKREYLGDLDARIAAEEASYAGYAA